MAKRQQPPKPELARLDIARIPAAISKLERRLNEVKEANPAVSEDLSILAASLCSKTNATLAEVFGPDTIEYDRAQARASSFWVNRMTTGFGPGISRGEREEAFREGRERTIAKLNSEIELLRERLEDDGDVSAIIETPSVVVSEDEIFLVHGRDDGTREEVARFIAKAGLKPIILHEQPNGGRTVIEKFEDRTASIGFAVVLLTPDDEGGARGGSMRPRARQNVVAELFYFMGKLGRSRVCALKKGDIEIPSDIAGLVYTELDAAGAWKMMLLRELKAAGYRVQTDALL